MKEKKYHIISCLFLILLSILNYYINYNIMWIIFLFSIIVLFISLKYKSKYKLINKESPTGIWLIEYGIGFNIFEIIFNSKSTVIGSIFILLGLLFILENAIIEKKEKNKCQKFLDY